MLKSSRGGYVLRLDVHLLSTAGRLVMAMSSRQSSSGFDDEKDVGALRRPVMRKPGVKCMIVGGVGGVLSVAWVAVGILIVLICVSLDA